MTWGDANIGGDNSAVQGQLQDLQQVQASDGAFAAILGRLLVSTKECSIDLGLHESQFLS